MSRGRVPVSPSEPESAGSADRPPSGSAYEVVEAYVDAWTEALEPDRRSELQERIAEAAGKRLRAAAMPKSGQDADDVAHDTLADLPEIILRYKASKKKQGFLSYLIGCARKKAIDRYRERQKQHPSGVAVPAGVPSSTHERFTPPSQAAIRSEIYTLLDNEIDRLDEIDQKIIQHYKEGLNYVDIGIKIKMHERVVCDHLHKSLGVLLSKLIGKLGGNPYTSQ